DVFDAIARLEEGERVVQNRPAAHVEENLGRARLHADALAGGDHDRGRAHGIGRARTRTPVASQSESISAISSSRALARANISASSSRVISHGPRTSTSVSRGTVRRTSPSTTSLQVSVIGA